MRPARLEQVRLQVSRIGMADYERYHYDKEKLKEISLPLGIIVVDQEADLEQVRMHINRLWEDLSATNNASFPALSSDWCFLDSCTAERYFRIDRAQESLHYVMDISGDELNILDPDLVTTRPKADDDASTSEKDTTSANSEQHVNGGDGSLLERHSADVIAAAEKGDLKWMKDLSSKGYSLLSIDENGRTALHHAAMNGQMDIVRFLIASAPVTILDMVDAESGRTALHLAASARRRNICCMLVAAGGSLSQKDAQGQTPRELALVAGDQELANYLKSQETFQKMVSSNMETTV